MNCLLFFISVIIVYVLSMAISEDIKGFVIKKKDKQ